ncbi:hypothetical protein [Oryzibacter oryziterrae]|uniref:hypothetical protein n=1 Tax=Oryzibacter oryziterrae TaxID=2766474 RepID=UPI001F1766DF|nr:hypothetical protein [Oryzibacter oryziterrae]
MLKRVFLAALGGLSVASAHAAVVEFRGAICLTSKTTACTADGWDVGDCFTMRYSPRNLGTNGPSTEFTLLGPAFADNYELATGSLVGTTFKAVKGTHVGRTGYAFSPTMKITKQTPATPTATSPTLAILGNITNFGDTTGCTIGFSATGVNRP